MSFSAIVLCVHIMLDSSGLAGAPIKPNFIYLCIWDLEEATSVISVRFLRNQNHHDYTMHVWVCSFLTSCFSENSEFFPPFTHTRRICAMSSAKNEWREKIWEKLHFHVNKIDSLSSQQQRKAYQTEQSALMCENEDSKLSCWNVSNIGHTRGKGGRVRWILAMLHCELLFMCDSDRRTNENLLEYFFCCSYVM